MSTLKVNKIEHTSTTDGGVSIDSSGNVTLPANTKVGTQNLPSAGPLSNRNLIINGAMQVAQRGTSISFAHDGNAGGYSLDQFRLGSNALDSWDGTITQESDAPEGFSNSLKLTTGTAEGTLDSDEHLTLYHRMEGQNFQHLKYGTSNAESVTLSFWVKSSQTGTFGLGVYRGEATGRVINKTYSINSANTWEYKTITIAGDTTDGITNSNGGYWWCTWHFLAGSGYTSSTATDWADYTVTNWAGGHEQNGVGTTAGATWLITGVQLEVGSVATPFEHRSYGDELRRCQRYYEVLNAQLMNYEAYYSSNGYGHYRGLTFAVPKRATPTITRDGPTSYGGLNGNSIGMTGFTDGVQFGSSSSSSGICYWSFSSSHKIYCTAEL